MNPANDAPDTSSAVVGGAPSRRIVRRRGTRPDQNRVTRGTSQPGITRGTIVMYLHK